MKTIQLLFVLSFILLSSCNQNEVSKTSFPELSGPYLGQIPPDSIPEIFAPGIVSTGMFTRDMAISADGKEIFFCVSLGNYNYATMLYTEEVDGVWTRPEVVPFRSNGKTIDFEPAFSPDGNRLYYLSQRPDGEEEAGDQDIWYVDREGEGWGEPVNPGAPLNTDGGEFFPSLTNDGYIYFTHTDVGSRLNQIFRSRVYADSFGTPEILPVEVNSGGNQFNAFVSPNHDYIIVPVAGREDAISGVDYYIVFRNENDQWSQPINMGEKINKDNARGWSPYVSPDGKYFFYMSTQSEDIPAADLTYDKLIETYNSPGNGNACIYWVNADFIEDLRNKEY